MLMQSNLFQLFIVNVSSLACEQFVLIITFAHGDYDYSDEAEDHAEDFYAVDGLPIVEKA